MMELVKLFIWQFRQYNAYFMKKGKNKVSLRYQSVLMRTQGSKTYINVELDEDRRKNI